MTQTLAASTRFELDVRKSRFLVHAAPCETADAALAFLASVSDRDASHNCWAYRIGQQYRHFDDGEPAGTAGKPILAAIDGQGLDAVVAVVSRWFGGIKLGAGGLVRAYGGSTSECLRRAERRVVVDYSGFELTCAFAHAASVHGLLGPLGALKVGEHYEADGLHLRIRVPTQHQEALCSALRDATRGQATMRALGDDR